MSARTAPARLPPAPLDASAGVRFGFAIARRQCRRAVARNAVRRVLREAARHAAAELAALAPAPGLHVLFRLKAPLPASSTANWREVKAGLRCEADALLAQLRAHLGTRGRA